MSVNHVVISAAGIGSRLGLDMPKCLVKLGKERLIYYLLDVLKDVPNVRIVVGFKEKEVIEYVKRIRKDVVFVRNPDYNKTTNSYSLYLGSHDLNEPFITIDGDMIIDQKNFDLFRNSVIPGKDLLGITRAKTEDAVFVKLDNKGWISEFSRDPISEYEWSGIACLSNIRVRREGKYIYQEIEPFLPIPSVEIDCWEIDTPSDLDLVVNEVEHIF